MRAKVLIAAGALLVGALLASRLGVAARALVNALLFGWWSYFARVLPRITIGWDGVATAVGCLVLFTVGLHFFLGWLHRELRHQAEESEHGPVRWPARRTIAFVVIVLVMFVAGTAATGVAHQAGWLLRDKNAWDTMTPASQNDDRLSDPKFSLRFGLGWGFSGYLSRENRWPATKYDEHGRALHSWQTAILGYLVRGARTASEIDFDRPWNHPRNSAYFRGIVPDYLNAEIATIRSPDGYALSHYAGNRHVLGVRQALTVSSLSDEASNTIVAGEVADGFKPWGDPDNLRDPAQGISGGVETFGGPAKTGANFLFADGSVRFLGKSTSPEVLRRFSVPQSPRRGPLRPVH
jgi:prepilin-type processing-associated H-X9-DG protein